MAVNRDFADYCCDLLASAGPIQAKRMFGGWGLSIDGLTIAIVTDLGSGEKLWLKADEDTRRRFEATQCERFTYDLRKGDATVSRSMNYYSAPDDAVESVHAMAPWARMALDSALKARLNPSKRKADKTRARTNQASAKSVFKAD